MKRVIIGVAAVLLVVVVIVGIILIRDYREDRHDWSQPLQVMVDGKRYCRGSFTDPPAEELICGEITSKTDGNPTQNDQTNYEACLNQPYAFVDGQLVVREKGNVWYIYQ